jgi:beta-1,4-mannosyltransferase
MMRRSDKARLSRSLVVGSWPGTGNAYVDRFCESLTINGVSVKVIKWPWGCFGKRIDLLQIHWLELALGEVNPFIGLLRATAVVLTLTMLRLRGVKLVWCVHNLEPHDARRRLVIFWRFYAGLVSRLVDGFITLSPSTVEIARTHFPGLVKKPAIFAWHPAYIIPSTPAQAPSWRERHGIDAAMTVLAFIGAVRLYKGLEELIAAFMGTSDPNLRLVIAGRVGKEQLRGLLENAVARDKRIILDLRWLSEQELAETVLAADIVVLPFKQTLHSGSVIYGLSCGKAVITPETDYANDLRRNVGPQWVRIYGPPLSPAALYNLCERMEGRPHLDFLSIRKSGKKLKTFYNSLVKSQCASNRL